jgi:uncharacterized protein YoxC
MVKVLNKYFANLGGIMLSGFNLGDALFRLIALAFIVLIIVLIMSFFRYNKKRNDQLNRIEQKMDDMNQGIKKDVEEGL